MKATFLLEVTVDSPTIEDAIKDVSVFCRVKTQDSTLQINETLLETFKVLNSKIAANFLP